jgi:hypothetical protein
MFRRFRGSPPGLCSSRKSYHFPTRGDAGIRRKCGIFDGVMTSPLAAMLAVVTQVRTLC